MKKHLIGLVVVGVLLGCGSQISQFYPDQFFDQDNIYENKSLGFAISYSGNWVIITDPNEMKGASRQFAVQLQKAGAELLYVGYTVEGTQGTRGIAINLNEDPFEYAQRIRELNKSSISIDFGICEYFEAARPMAKWEYSIGDFRFVEFFFLSGTYNLRIAFWTKTSLFEKFFPVYEKIICSVLEVGRF